MMQDTKAGQDATLWLSSLCITRLVLVRLSVIGHNHLPEPSQADRHSSCDLLRQQDMSDEIL